MKRRRYTIQSSDCVNFVTGVNRQGDQVIMGIPGPCALAAFFDEHGEFVRYETRVLPGPSRPLVGRPSDETIAKLWTLLDSWKSEIGLREGTISIFAFRIDALDVRIGDLPDYLNGLFTDPSVAHTDKSGAEYAEDIQEWRREGRFVLRWGNEYWLDRFGAVIAT